MCGLIMRVQSKIQVFNFLLIIFLIISQSAFSDDELIDDKGTSDKQYTVRNIIITGNKVTKEKVILKEMTFKSGDKLKEKNLLSEKEQSINNIKNTSLFNFVYLDYEFVERNQLDVYIRVEERWYFWAVPLFEHTDRNLSVFLKNGNWDMINYGVYLRYNNFRGRKEVLMLRLRTGFSNQLLFNYDSPDYKSRLGWGLWIDYNFYDKAPVSTYDDQPFYVTTLGTQLYRSMSNAIYLQYRSGLYQRHKLVVNYYSHSVADTVINVNSNFLPEARSRTDYLELEYRYEHDTRDYKYYPLKGGFRRITLKQTGLGLLNSDLDFLTVSARVHQYVPIVNRLYAGTEWLGNYSWAKSVPYFYHNGLGYRDFIRGYEYYVMDGNSFFLAKNRITFELVPTKVKNFKIDALNKFSKIHYAFYLNCFYDFGYVNNNDKLASANNKMVNNYLYGYGLGIDFVTFYDKVFSFNYAFNKYHESGFFFHLNLKI